MLCQSGSGMAQHNVAGAVAKAKWLVAARVLRPEVGVDPSSSVAPQWAVAVPTPRLHLNSSLDLEAALQEWLGGMRKHHLKS